jgi:hypothetical protein
MKNSAFLMTAGQITTIMLSPLLLTRLTVSALISPAYPRYVYGRSDFPPDPHGMTANERLELALAAVAYLQQSEPAARAIQMLAGQAAPGVDSPLYSPAELEHLVDVKNITDALRFWAFLLVQPHGRLLAYRAAMQGGC